MEKLYDIAAVRAMEKTAFAGEDSFAVMRRAGEAAAKHAQEMLGKELRRPVLALAGGGNNGGDAFVAATKLREAGAEVKLVFAGDENKQPPDAKRARAMWQDGGSQNGGGEILREIPAADYSLVLDGLLGIGASRATGGRIAELILQTRGRRILAIDAPSGVCANTGALLGDAVFAERTVTFFANKPGLCTGDGAAAAGTVFVEELGFSDFPPPSGFSINSAAGLNLQQLRRTKNAHKGTFGAAVIVGGADGMVGALALAARAAVRLGAGKVFALCAAKNPPPFDFACPEAMWRRAEELPQFSSAACIAAGPGLGMKKSAAMLLQTAINSAAPLVADADALNLMAKDKTLAAQFAKRKTASVITPHPAEAARLLNCATEEILRDRIRAAKTLSEKFNAAAVLKGAGSVIAAEGEWAVCGAGNPGLAQAGAGDVLTGIVAALLAQTGDAVFAARAGVWLHGAAADELAKNGGEIGLDLGALPSAAAKLLNRAV
ncbi:MAG: NAD(P)H-hydrate dehydratase [Betaproteobacteria bacterium]|nr:NAD(P)H-hydrate dehydratase [Betaproteobacteria bacterium]